MAADLNSALSISASGMDAQTARLRVIAQNIANQPELRIRGEGILKRSRI
jgi:flagellar basal body rod protein FlgC